MCFQFQGEKTLGIIKKWNTQQGYILNLCLPEKRSGYLEPALK